MRPKKPSSELELYQSHLEQILNHDHGLYKLAHQIDWAVFEEEFGKLYDPGKGRPGLQTRLMAGLHYLITPSTKATSRWWRGFWRILTGSTFAALITSSTACRSIRLLG